MYIRQFRAHVGNRVGALVLGALPLLAAGVFLTFGILLIVGVTVAGLVLGVDAALYRRVQGAPPRDVRSVRPLSGLDPALEVLPPSSTSGAATGENGRDEPPLVGRG